MVSESGTDQVKVIDIASKKDADSRDALRKIADESPKIHGVIVLRLMADGSQRLDTSDLNMYEKVFLAAYLNSFINQWFEPKDLK